MLISVKHKGVSSFYCSIINNIYTLIHKVKKSAFLSKTRLCDAQLLTGSASVTHEQQASELDGLQNKNRFKLRRFR